MQSAGRIDEFVAEAARFVSITEGLFIPAKQLMNGVELSDAEFIGFVEHHWGTFLMRSCVHGLAALVFYGTFSGNL